jgi:hypothetical protein
VQAVVCSSDNCTQSGEQFQREKPLQNEEQLHVEPLQAKKLFRSETVQSEEDSQYPEASIHSVEELNHVTVEDADFSELSISSVNSIQADVDTIRSNKYHASFQCHEVKSADVYPTPRI